MQVFPYATIYVVWIAAVAVRHSVCDSRCFPAAAAHHLPLRRGVHPAPHQHIHGTAAQIAFFATERSWRITTALGTSGCFCRCLALFAFPSCFTWSCPMLYTWHSRIRDSAFLDFLHGVLWNGTRSEDDFTFFARGHSRFCATLAALFAARGVAAA